MPPEQQPAQTPKAQIAAKLKDANNVLVTVSNNPSVDQLAAAIGLTLLLNKLGKHATAVFSGEVPSTLEFLKPEETIEKNTDSLRDFIVSLDKAKADKLRYKVEDKVVKIFITPYRTSLSEKDLEFSQGDFNVDAVVALGVHEQTQLDQAITTHGRILHDATVISINNQPGAELGTINWLEVGASSLCEMVVSMTEELRENLLDAQMATAFLTGIVAETKRFSNEKTSPATMSVSSRLMAAGANQQLVASKLEESQPPSQGPDRDNQAGSPAALPPSPPKDDGELDIPHDEPDKPAEEKPAEPPKPEEPEDSIHIDEHGTLHVLEEEQRKAEEKAAEESKMAGLSANTRFVLDPPTLGGTLTANAHLDHTSGSTTSDPMSQPFGRGRILSHDTPPASPPTPVVEPPKPAESPAVAPPAIQGPPPNDTQTLTEIEKTVHSPHIYAEQGAAGENPVPPAVGDARNLVDNAIQSAPPAPEAIKALNAQPLGDPLQSPAPAWPSFIPQGNTPAPSSTDAATPASAPPPVPPPMMPPPAS